MRRSIGANNIEQSRTRYVWDKSYRLQRMVNELNGAKVNFEYDVFDNLISAEYKESSGAETIYRVPDKIGNLFKTKERSDRKYSAGGKLIEDPQFYFHYDGEGNLVFKEYKTNGSHTAKERQEYAKENGIKLRGGGTGWLYEWGSNSMLQQVISPNDIVTKFNYDPLGRRIAKQYKGKVTRWMWDGNVPLHQWSYEGEFPPQSIVDERGELKLAEEPVENVITWVHEDGSFVPCARIEGSAQYSIVADYLGTPTHAFDSKGAKVWERELDCYGAVRKELGIKGLVPQLYQGQMLDEETGLAYNRFRYYDNENGSYISQDPIGLAGNNPTLYGYVKDVNSWVDQLGLQLKNVNPSDINFSQRTVSDVRVWDQSKYDKPIDVMVRDGQMVSYDNRRLLAAQNAELKGLDVNIVNGSDIMPGSKKTWNEAFDKRFNDIRNVREGGAVPNKGSKEKPKLPSNQH